MGANAREATDPAQAGPGGTRDELRGLSPKLSEAERIRIIVEHFRPLVRSEQGRWIGDLADVVAAQRLSPTAVRTVCGDLAWCARLAGQPYPDARPAAAGDGSTAAQLGLVTAYVCGYRLRFDYRFALLDSFVGTWLRDHPGDALLLAFAAFAALGADAPQGLELYRAALASPNADNKSRSTCLVGIWFAHRLPSQPQEMLDLANAMTARGEANAGVYYRRAAALRKLGRYQQAVDDVDRAIGMLDAGETEVHQDFIRERETIVSTMETRAHVVALTEELRVKVSEEVQQRIDAASEELAERIEQAQRVVSDGLLKLVEILGLFVALIGFVAGTGAAALSTQSFRQRLISMTLVLVGSIAFFVLLRVVTSFRRRT